MTKKGENIYHRKDGRWEGRYRFPNETKYHYVYGKTYKECKELRYKKIAEGPSKDSKYEFIILFKKWLYFKKGSIKLSSYLKYETTINKYFIPFFKNNVYEITSDYIRDFINYLINKSLLPKTIHEQYKLLKQIITFFYPDLETIFHISKKYLPRLEKCSVRVIEEKERSILESFLLNNLSYLNLSIYLSMSLGLRIGEICALKWNDIDLDNKKVIVSKTMQRVKNLDWNNTRKNKTKIIITDVKTKASIREIPLPDKIINILSSFKTSNSYYVTTGNESYIEPRVLSYYFQKILIKLNIEVINFHTLRHTFASRYAEKIGDIKSLSEILGHSTSYITMQFYVHPSVNFKRESINLLL